MHSQAADWLHQASDSVHHKLCQLQWSGHTTECREKLGASTLPCSHSPVPRVAANSHPRYSLTPHAGADLPCKEPHSRPVPQRCARMSAIPWHRPSGECQAQLGEQAMFKPWLRMHKV